MRKFLPNFLLVLCTLMGISHVSNSQIVISQVYGGGGNSGATYTNDFIELFNRGNTTINITGWSVQYASSTGTTWSKTDLSGSIAPGQYYLIQQAQGAGGTTPLPTPDAVGTLAMSGTNGKVVLLNINTLITSGTSCPSGSTIEDIVGFGSANCFEGAGATPVLSNTTAAIRNGNGCTDAGNNSADFSTGAPTPRNTASPTNLCSGPPPGLTVSVSAGTNAAEPSTSGTFNITLSAAAPAGGITVTYNFTGSATLNTDYSDPQSGTITIPAGSNSGTITLPVIDDIDVEGTEIITINLQTVTSPATINTGTANINLLDNDFPPSPFISLVTIYNQDFNSLSNTGTSSAVPSGWLFSESGTNANSLYTAGNGSSTSGDTYSFGETGNTERAFGTLLSSSLTSTIGAQIQNNTGTTITKLKISYTGEEWRLGAEGRTDKLSFQYSLDATSLSTGTWNNVTELDFITPVTTIVGAKDGNNPVNQTNLIYTLRNLSIPNGAVFLIRWEEFNASGSDDGLGIDNFSIEANPIDITPPLIVSLSPVNGASNVSLTSAASITFNEDIQKGTGNIRIRRISDNSIFQTIDITTVPVSVTGSAMSFTITNLEPNTGYYIEIDNGAIKDLDGNLFTGISGSMTWSFTTGINIYVANFQNCTTGLSDGFTQYSVTGAIVWGCTTFGRDPSAPAGTTAFPYGVQINGFSGGTNVPNIDWLISPSFDLTGTTFPLLSFWSRAAFNGLPLQLKVSTDYVSGDPTLANWTDIDGRFPAQASNIWTLSENINLSAFKQSNVHFAFVYTSTDVDGARWTLDDISLGNSPTPPPPSITVSTLDIQFGFTASGSNSDRSFTVRGNDIIGDITLTASSGFSLSTAAAGPFTPNLTLTQASSNNIFRTVYVRFSPTQANINYTGTVTISTPSVTNAIVNLHGTSIDPANTLEVVNWNIEWFGSTANGPTNDALQQTNVQTILQNIGADIYGLVEVVDESRLAAVVANMPGYNYVISNFGSHTNTSVNPTSALAEAQKLAFVYKTSVFSNITTAPLLSQGINSAADISNPAYNYFASGRFPYMLSADATLNGITQNVKFVLVHAKANTSPTITSYNRRKSSSDTLNYTLNSLYPNDKIIILGDFNDDLDSTITAGINPRITSYSAFIDDNLNFAAPTLSLSLAGKKSTVSYNDVIDHAVISTEMKCYYMANSANILTDVATLVSNYGSSTSDHYPVFTRYSFDQAPSASISYASSPYCNTGTATITRTGAAGGTYTSTTGLSIDGTSGSVNLNTSTPGMYTVTYTIPASGGCPPFVTTTSISVNPPPTISCPSNITVNNSPGICGATVTYPSATATGTPTPAVTYSHPSGSVFPVGTTTVTATATNICGTATCTFTVTVNDTQAPVVNCPSNVTVSNNPGQCGAIVNYPTPTATDNCPGVTITSVPASGTLFPVGLTTVNVTARDAAGNTSNCTFTVRVNDTQAPVITCPANITVASTIGSCSAIVNYTINATDNCPGVTTSLVSGLASGSAFPVGTTTVTHRATDGAGLTTTCSFTVTVSDSQSPVINVQPANRTVCVGASATFNVTASNAVSYQWQSWNGSTWNNIPGATASGYTVSNTSLSMNTNSFRVQVTGLCTTVTSAHASLYVNNLPGVSITASPLLSLYPGQSTNIFSITTPSGGSYVWQYNGTTLGNASGSQLNNLTANNQGSYRLIYTDANGCINTSNNLVLSAAASNNLFVYPNPSNGRFSVRFFNAANEQMRINVYDQKGTKIITKSVIGTAPYSVIDIYINNRYPSGVYLVELLNSSGQKLGDKQVIVVH